MATPRPRGGMQRLPGAAPIFAALGDATRLQIVARLCDGGPAPIVRLTEGTRVSRQAVSKHLRALQAAGLVRCERAGRESIWALEPSRLEEARHWLDRISGQWDQVLQRLAAFLEEERE